MARARNLRIYNTDPEVLATLRSEYIMLGFDTSLENGCLTVYALRRKKPKKKDNEKRPGRESR